MCPPFLGLRPTKWSFLNVSPSREDKLPPNRPGGEGKHSVCVCLSACLSVCGVSLSLGPKEGKRPLGGNTVSKVRRQNKVLLMLHCYCKI